MQGCWFDYAAAGIGALSALFWLLSAFVNFPFGFDMDAELAKSAKKAGSLNAVAAVLTAIAVAIPALKTFLVLRGIVV